MRDGFAWSRIGTHGVNCEHNHKLTGSAEGKEYLDMMSDSVPGHFSDGVIFYGEHSYKKRLFKTFVK